MKTDINFDELRKDANDIFHSGFTCSESVIYTIRKAFDLDMSDDAIKMSSGFPWGLGGGEIRDSAEEAVGVFAHML